MRYDALLNQLPDRTVLEAGQLLLDALSNGRVTPEQFLRDPMIVTGPPHLAPRYVAQVAWRALHEDYETIDQVISALSALNDRNPPGLVPKRAPTDRTAILEARVLGLQRPEKQSDGSYAASIEAVVTTGDLAEREIQIRANSAVNANVCFIVPYLWIHAAVAVYNLVRSDDRVYDAVPDSFLVLEPLYQVNATAVARSLHCPKPQVDQLRRGRGDTTIHTLKGTIVHALFDRLLEGETDLERACGEAVPSYRVALASVTDRFFNETAFRSEILRHARRLGDFIRTNTHLLDNPQLELKRYSATLGIQGRIDALFRAENRLDILELKTGSQIRPSDHVQLFVYRLLLTDLIRSWEQDQEQPVEVTSRLLSSTGGGFAPLRVTTDFQQVLDARNKLVAHAYALGRPQPHVAPRFAGFDAKVCGDCPAWTSKRCEESTALFGDRPDAPEREDLKYFRRLTTLVEQERWLGEQDLAELLDDSRLDRRVQSFRTICNARIGAADRFLFEFPVNTSDLAPGDSVLIHARRISSTPIFHGTVKSIGSHHAEIRIPLTNLRPESFAGQEWILDRLPVDYTSEASHTALYDFLTLPMDGRKKAILEGGCDFGPPSAVDSPLLNESQRSAVGRSLDCAPFHLIWGPPGTGKTRVIPEIASRVKGSVLLGAFTNTAVDKTLLALLDHDPSVRFVRVGRSADSPELASRLGPLAPECFTEDLALRCSTVLELRETLDGIRIVASTAHRAATSPYVRRRLFEMAIVDEATQLTEPLTLGLILRAQRFVLIGDDRQLPPVTRTHGLRQSMFERLKQGSRNITLLDTQYRMHPEIVALSNRLFYSGRLRSGVAAADRTFPEGPPVTFVPVESKSETRENPDEAAAVVDLVRRCLATAPTRTIGVISPFRAQVVLLRRLLEGLDVTVDTVERFQGGERDAIIISFVRPRAAGFVFDDRRLNVALTRARRKLVLVGHPELLRELSG